MHMTVKLTNTQNTYVNKRQSSNLSTANDRTETNINERKLPGLIDFISSEGEEQGIWASLSFESDSTKMYCKKNIVR